MGLYAVCIHLVNSYGQEKLHYGNFGLGFVVCIFFFWGMFGEELVGRLVGSVFLVFTDFLSTTV